jgi:hypothetical protein
LRGYNHQEVLQWSRLGRCALPALPGCSTHERFLSSNEMNPVFQFIRMWFNIYSGGRNLNLAGHSYSSPVPKWLRLVDDCEHAGIVSCLDLD